MQGTLTAMVHWAKSVSVESSFNISKICVGYVLWMLVLKESAIFND